MKKIPVGSTIAHAYSFAFGEFLPLLKLTWLPFLLVLAGNFLAQPQVMGFSRGISTNDYSGMTMPGPLLLLLYAAVILISVMWMTAIYQYALGRPEARHRGFYFSLARPMWRVLGGFLLLLLVLLALLVIYVIAILAVLFCFRLGLAAAHVSDEAMKNIATLDIALAFLVGYCGFMFCLLRFGFLLAAATIAEDRIALVRSWTLSHGNFWRMLVIALAVFLPLLILEIAAFYAFGLFPHIPAGATLPEMQGLQRAANAALVLRMQHYWYFVYPGGAVMAFVTYALAAGTQSFAWRALTESEPTPNRL